MKPKKSKNFLMAAFPPPEFLTMPASGIDISDGSIHFINLIQKRGDKILDAFGEYLIPEGVVSRGDIRDINALSEILKKIKIDRGIRFVRVSLPEEKAYLFRTQVPYNASKDEISSILEFKLEEYVPLSPAESVFDYEILPKHENSDQHLDVEVVVYPKQIVEKYTHVFESAGLVPLSFEIETQAIVRSVMKEGYPGTYMVVDFGKTKIGFSIINNGILSFTSTLEISKDEIRDAIIKHFAVEKSEVDRIKDEEELITNKGNKELNTVIMSTVESLRDNIKTHYMYWKGRIDDTGNRVNPVEKIVLCGGNSNLVGLPEYLSGSLKIPVERANVWINVFSLDDFIPEMSRFDSLSYATAIGLALRGVK